MPTQVEDEETVPFPEDDFLEGYDEEFIRGMSRGHKRTKKRPKMAVSGRSVFTALREIGKRAFSVRKRAGSPSTRRKSES